MSEKIRVLAINPGSTSTKIALFDDFTKLFKKTVIHSLQKLSGFPKIQDQLEYRTEMVEKAMADKGYAMEDVDAFVGRGGGLYPMPGGVYKVTDLLTKHASVGISGMHHPAQLGSQIAKNIADKYGKPAYVVNPPDTDEFCDVARVTGVKGVYRESHLHALNQKETAIRFCGARGLDYTDVNLIVCHIGGGISITAHKKGRMIDSNDIIKGSGPLSPTRAGDLPYMNVIDMAYSGKYTKEELINKLNRSGGLVDYFGTADLLKIYEMVNNGDRLAEVIIAGMIYQHAKYIGAMAAALRGEVEAILLTGSIANSKIFVDSVAEYVSWISEVVVMPGEFELEALAGGVVRVMRGELKEKKYTGKPIWSGF